MSRSGETGKRTDFKNRRSRELEGSTPSFGTNPYDKEIHRVYGPYIRTHKKNKRRRQMVIIFTDGSKTTMTFARWQMTQHLGRRLLPTEHVDHKNEDSLDDRLENYQILTPGENAAKTNRSRPSPLKGTELGWTHGTQYGWMKKKCTCPPCTSAKRKWHDARNARRRKQ